LAVVLSVITLLASNYYHFLLAIVLSVIWFLASNYYHFLFKRPIYSAIKNLNANTRKPQALLLMDMYTKMALSPHTCISINCQCYLQSILII
jgi:hypothetical protein